MPEGGDTADEERWLEKMKDAESRVGVYSWKGKIDRILQEQ